MSQPEFDPEYVFSHHTATPEKLANYHALHLSAKQFAQTILEHVPACADRAAALRLLREASMMACAAVALDGRLKGLRPPGRVEAPALTSRSAACLRRPSRRSRSSTGTRRLRSALPPAALCH